MSLPVIAIFDIGKTNKKVFLLDEDYAIAFEQHITIAEILDEDGEPCEDLQQLTQFIYRSLDEVLLKEEFEIRAVNFSAYGASLVYIDETGKPLTPLYNYLKEYPYALKEKFYKQYGGEVKFSLETASPVLGSLNSGMQLYRMKYGIPEVYEKIKYALHLPQYLNYLLSKNAVSEMTSIGCHTNLWNFQKNEYHEWVEKENLHDKLPQIVPSGQVQRISYTEKKVLLGVGLHDSSAALIPYMDYFPGPFVLISTGTWCISLNPFNTMPLTAEELSQDCLCYLTQEGKQVKASRLFAGAEHEYQTRELALFFDKPLHYYKDLFFDETLLDEDESFDGRNLAGYENYEKAYHQFIHQLVKKQFLSTRLVMTGRPGERIFVDGGFSSNEIFMRLMARTFPDTAVYAATIPQSAAIGAAMVIHEAWNKKSLPANLILLKKYSSGTLHSSNQ